MREQPQPHAAPERDARTARASALEALLFLFGEPTPLDTLARALDCPPEGVAEGLEELERQLQERGSGLRLLRAPGGVQLVTAEAQAGLVERTVKAGMRASLKPAAAETLAIIAYRGPISRAAVEAIRGVNSSFTLRLLAIRGLVERFPNPNDSRSYLYEASAAFLRHLGVTDVRDLPDYAVLREHKGLTAMEATAEAPAPPAASAPAADDAA